MRAVTFTLLLLSSYSWASEPVATSFWSDKAIGGHDTLGYYAGDTLEGSKQHKVRWQAADWYFASAESAARFAASPEDYMPHYNGHCANALSLGEGLISTNGKVWEFFGDELYLFYAEKGRQRWLSGDWQAYKAIADQAWQQALATP